MSVIGGVGARLTCWQRRNMILVALSLSSRVSALLQLLHNTYLYRNKFDLWIGACVVTKVQAWMKCNILEWLSLLGGIDLNTLLMTRTYFCWQAVDSGSILRLGLWCMDYRSPQRLLRIWMLWRSAGRRGRGTRRSSLLICIAAQDSFKVLGLESSFHNETALSVKRATGSQFCQKELLYMFWLAVDVLAHLHEISADSLFGPLPCNL